MFDIHSDESVKLKREDIAGIEQRLNYKKKLAPVAYSTKKQHDKKGEATIIRSCIDFLKHLVHEGKLTWNQADKIMEIIPNTAHWGRYTGNHSKDQKDLLIAVMNSLWRERTPERSERRTKSRIKGVTEADKLNVRIFHGKKNLGDYEGSLPPTPQGKGKETSAGHLLDLAAQKQEPALKPGRKIKESDTPYRPRPSYSSSSAASSMSPLRPMQALEEPTEPEPALSPEHQWGAPASHSAREGSPRHLRERPSTTQASPSLVQSPAPARARADLEQDKIARKEALLRAKKNLMLASERAASAEKEAREAVKARLRTSKQQSAEKAKDAHKQRIRNARAAKDKGKKSPFQ